MSKYDYLIVGFDLFEAMFACMARRGGRSCLMTD